MHEDLQKLIRRFSVLKGMELEAYATYAKALPNIPNNEDSELLALMMRDEQRHAEIAQEIIDLLQSGE